MIRTPDSKEHVVKHIGPEDQFEEKDFIPLFTKKGKHLSTCRGARYATDSGWRVLLRHSSKPQPPFIPKTSLQGTVFKGKRAK
jgi:hypothetical protein